MSDTVATAELLRRARLTGISHPNDLRITDIPAQTWRHVPTQAEIEWRAQWRKK
jgi:hypothetical protein